MSYRTLTVDAMVLKAALEAAQTGRSSLAVADLLLAALRPSLGREQGTYAPARNPFVNVLDDERRQLMSLLNG